VTTLVVCNEVRLTHQVLQESCRARIGLSQDSNSVWRNFENLLSIH